jgi:hypothetical protein|tara:strand:- start:426 stop:641 length:216 start_codon:yes stop_codon:yes gene_type:complete
VLKKLFKKIMADLKEIRQKNKTVGKNKQELELTSNEIDFLLQTIASSKFEGKDVQIVYETAVKLQQLLNTK